jgi:multiple sugar transport system permease protein
MAKPRSAMFTVRTVILPHAGLALAGLLFLLPFVWLVLTSLKTVDDIFRFPIVWWPETIRWSNYTDALKAIPFMRYTANTAMLCVLAVIGQVVSSPLAAYGFSRLQFKGRDTLFFIMMGSMMLPYQVTMVPVYVLFNKMNLVDSYWPIILQNLFAIPFYVFLMRQFFLSIPYELTEAAKIDGASELRIYWQVIVPLAMPAIYSVALFAFLNEWKDFLGPLLYLNDPELWTLSIGLRAFIGENKVDWGLLMAAATMFTVPIVALYFFVQKKFIQGISLTGFK